MGDTRNFSVIPAESDNPNGLHQRYNVAKANGEQVDPRAIYLVLRLDLYGDDEVWTKLCREAAHSLADNTKMRAPHLAQMADELRLLCEKLMREATKSHEGGD